jgi:hypothetical protein
MARQINLADPDYEPTDEELQKLSRDAFATIRQQRARIDAASRNRIADLRAEALRRLVPPRSGE